MGSERDRAGGANGLKRERRAGRANGLRERERERQSEAGLMGSEELQRDRSEAGANECKDPPLADLDPGHVTAASEYFISCRRGNAYEKGGTVLEEMREHKTLLRKLKCRTGEERV